MSFDAPTFDPDAVRERYVLVVIGGGGVVEHALPARGRLAIGRALECDVRIDDPAISRTHAVLIVGERLSLMAQSQTGRTRIEGREIATGAMVPLEAGQLVEIGKSRLVVRRERSTAPSGVMDLAAKSELPVLVLGETGAGKEVAMEQIVARSSRSGRPIVRVDCAALPERPFEGAGGGTVFLDEVASTRLADQARLLGLIETADARVIASSNANVLARVADGSFRQDLYFRLAGVVVTVPPLRERQSEIPDLARTLLAAEAARAKVAAPALSEGALALLVAYRWPGNIRELRNVVSGALHVATGGVIEPDHLTFVPPAPAPASPSAPGVAAPVPAVEAPGTPAYERARIITAMERAKGNQKEAARLLGMTRRMLMYRLDSYGLPRPRKR